MDEHVRKEYLKKMRKEVDFHHKMAFSFEKAASLRKRMKLPNPAVLNLEIIECVSEYSAYIELDPTALFYTLFFCVYYKNPELVDFIRVLI
mmetsp:Transcript_12389/g.19300  ORF Transcript_12389/g.19300 Transcript_12389/m.19300 type:complete len:91 (+) Transcript_12389:665-937(+)